jgi:hypothetical protein
MTPEPRTWTLAGRHDGEGAWVVGGPSLPPTDGVQAVAVDDIVSDEAVERVAKALAHHFQYDDAFDDDRALRRAAGPYFAAYWRFLARAALAALLPSYGQKERD